MTLQPATRELLALATATRPDIQQHDLEGAIAAARTAGWTWARVLVEVARMLARDETPHDLREACRDPLQLRRPRHTLGRPDSRARDDRP